MIQHEWLTVDENYPVIIKCSQDADGEFLIPEGVIGIAPYAFKDCTLLKDIILPDEIEDVEFYTFRSCKDLRRIRIPESVEFIDPIAFDECPSSLTVELPATVLTKLLDYLLYIA